MNLPVYELSIQEDLQDDAEVSFIALVDKPAIQRDFVAFGEDVAFESYNDYPESAKNNAERGIRLNEELGNKCATQVGKVRAQQIMQGENLSKETIKRTYSYLSRAKEYYNPDDSEACGTISYLLWGGDPMLNWCESKMNDEDFKASNMAFAIQDEDKHIISGPIMLADKPIYRSNDKFGEHYVVFKAETIKDIAIKFSKKGYQDKVNLMHDKGMAVDGLIMFESFIVDKERGIMPMAGYEDAKDGSWFGSFYVENEQVWKLIKEGKVKGFSVEGFFEYPMDKKEPSYAEKKLAELAELLKVPLSNK